MWMNLEIQIPGHAYTCVDNENLYGNHKCAGWSRQRLADFSPPKSGDFRVELPQRWPFPVAGTVISVSGVTRAGHLRYFWIFSITKKWFLAFFIWLIGSGLFKWDWCRNIGYQLDKKCKKSFLVIELKIQKYLKCPALLRTWPSSERTSLGRHMRHAAAWGASVEEHDWGPGFGTMIWIHMAVDLMAPTRFYLSVI